MTEPSNPFTQDELLVFAQGRAAPELADRINNARATDRGLAAELALMEGLKPALAVETGQNPPGELDWRRLETQIRRERTDAPALPRQDARQSSSNMGGRVVMWKVAAVFFGLAAIGQAAYFAAAPSTRDPGYRTATQIENGQGVVVVVISFSPSATEAEIRGLLQSVKARLVDGPSASGLYRVAFMTSDALADGTKALKEANIVTLVADQ